MLISTSETILFRSPNPQELYCYTPALAHGFGGRIIASFDIAGPALNRESGPKSAHGDWYGNQMRIYISDDSGVTWRETGRLPMLHARVFAAENCLYALGHGGDLLISRSADNGETWEEPSVLDSAAYWHQSACAAEIMHGKIYITMEQAPIHETAPKRGGGDPVLMSAALGDDLTKRKNWNFSNLVDLHSCLKLMPPETSEYGKITWWLESNVVFQRDENNFFYDPEFKKMLVFLRTRNRLGLNSTMMLQGVEKPDGKLELTFPRLPDGRAVTMVQIPGGYMKFQILWDEPSRRYWLITSAAEYSTFTKPEALHENIRWFDERQRLELYYSRNLFDWCCAGVVAKGKEMLHSRHYAGMLLCGDELLVLSRSGDSDARSTHDTNLITLHRVPNFRALVI